MKLAFAVLQLMHRKHIHYSIKKGVNFSTEVKQLETDLTEDMLVSYVQQLVHLYQLML
jgi:hypothetical protein